MNQASKVERTAVEELLQEDSPEGYYETLSTFYEAYVSSPHCDGSTGEQRLQVLKDFKSLRRFLWRIKQERKINRHPKESVWIK
jgi:hypothetical protein